MLNIRANVISIDYPATFHTLYPFISEHFKESDKHNFLKSFIIELGDNAEKVFASLLEYLDETQRKELIMGLVNRNSTRLIKLLNDKLKENEIGKCIEADSLGMCMAEDDHKNQYCISGRHIYGILRHKHGGQVIQVIHTLEVCGMIYLFYLIGNRRNLIHPRSLSKGIIGRAFGRRGEGSKQHHDASQENQHMVFYPSTHICPP